MELIQKSGLFYPNKFGLILINSVADLLGKDRFNALFSYCENIENLRFTQLNNLEKNYDFSEISRLMYILEDRLGRRGARGVSNQIGKKVFRKSIIQFGRVIGLFDGIKNAETPDERVKFGLEKIAEFITETSDQVTLITEYENRIALTVYQCPICLGRKEDYPICYLTQGFLQEATNWLSGGIDYRIYESKCIAMGDEVCEFQIVKKIN